MTLHALLIAPFETLGFMRAALVACVALALVNGVLGTLLVLRRMSLDGEVLGHAVMPGAAIGFLYAGPSPTWLATGGLASGLAVAALTGLAVDTRARRDAGLVAFYLVALSLGVMLVAWRGSNVDLVRVLFGTVLAIDRPALLQIATAASVILLTVAALYRPFAVGAFDAALLRASGVRAPYGMVFVALVVLALVASFQAFGTLLAVGPMLLPAAAARCWGLGVAGSMALACVFGVLASVAGLLVSYHGNLPSGPAIVLASGALFGVSLAATSIVPRRVALRAAVLLGALLAAPDAHAADRMPVVATFSVIGDMLANVGGDHVAITTIVGAGGDSELYQPNAGDVAAVASARAVFLNDLNEEFEPWLEPLLRQAAFKGTKVVVSRQARTLTAEEEHPVSGRQLPTAIDQHAWLDPRNGVIYVRNITQALARLDPDNAGEYRTRAAAYTKQIQALDDWAHKEMAAVPSARRRLLTSHDSLQYLANAYGITMLTINGWTNNSEPSAAELAKLTQRIRAERVRALFLDSITDPRTMQRVAAETGAVIGGTLYGDTLSPAGGEADTYLKMLSHDIATLKAGMLNN
ncbi:MAG TPA: zinc ABC transporter substrate-binding protein [Acetobacteraceae bacterium]|nr:zinc ABC transporter substrate-binding protein [Acetobacteraceae bacterium]